jgi:hypothetical protein
MGLLMSGVAGATKFYKHGSHTVHDCKYRLVWVTKYYVVLGGEVGRRCRECYARRAAGPSSSG